MTDRPPFDSLVGNIQQEVNYSTEKRLGARWSKLARILYKDSESNLDKLPIVIGTNSSQPFTPGTPVTIPLLGEGRLEIGRTQRYFEYEGKPQISGGDLLLRIHAPSHRSSDQESGKTFDCEIALSPHGSIYGANIRLLKQDKPSPTSDEIKKLNEARRFMALFDPSKDIDWGALKNPTEQQNIVLQQAGWHPPPPAPPTT